MVRRRPSLLFVTCVVLLVASGCTAASVSAPVTGDSSPAGSVAAAGGSTPALPPTAVLSSAPSSTTNPTSALSVEVTQSVQPSQVPAPPASEASTAAALPDCTPESLATGTPGVITLATSAPLEPPWFTGTDPATSDGYEAQVGRRIAATLGFGTAQQKWQLVAATDAVDGSAADFDIYLGEIGDGGAVDADLSSGYYSITDAIVMTSAAKAAFGGRAPDYRSSRIGVLAGSTGQTAVAERGASPVVVDDVPSLMAALNSAAIDAAVLPTPDALRAASAEAGLAVVGQLPPGRWQPDQFHLVLAKGSPLTPCVTAAVDRLRIEGTLDQLTASWVDPLAPLLG